MVYLQDARGVESILLPLIASPTLLMREGRSYHCNSRLSSGIVDALHNRLDLLVESMGPGKLKKESLNASSGVSGTSSNTPGDFVIYVPASDVHVKIKISHEESEATENLTRFSYFKENVPLWHVNIQANEGITLSVSESTLRAQYHRMESGQSHGFTLLVRDFIRNAVALAASLGAHVSPQQTSRLFFPGVFDLAADVRQHYNEKVGKFVSQEQSKAGGIRKYNNLIKSVLLNHFVPGGNGSARSGPAILDLACGHGQDLMKYRNKFPSTYVGLDISQEALNEARRRYKEAKFRYPAEFMQGNLMLPETFAEIRKKAQAFGHTDESPFDVISMQLALHYVVGSEDDARKFFKDVFGLLKPGGRFIATYPCCDRIARRLRDIKLSDTLNEVYFGNEMYRVSFDSEQAIRVLPDLENSLRSKSEEELDTQLQDVDFDKVAADLGAKWGYQYKFFLTQTIDNQEEYVVPNAALQNLVKEFNMDVEMTANFAEVVSHYTEQESPVVRDFRKHNPELELNPDEDEVFRFYRAIVLRKE